MRVLIVDDDPTVRTVLRRILTRFFDIDVVEAQDGLEALTCLTREHFAIVFLDVAMPTMSGQEVLNAIRRSPQHARLPVIAVTATNDERSVREMLHLGVSEYLVKPLRPARVVERLERLLEARQEGREDDLEFPRRQLLELTPATRVLVVDGDAEYREFFTRHFGARCQVTAVADGLEALEQCLREPPYAVFIGPHIGLLRGDLLAQKLRRTPRADSIRMIGLVPPALVKRHDKRSPFHAVLPRTFVATVLDRSLQPLLRQPSRVTGVLDVVPQLKLTIISAVEQACSSVFNTEMQYSGDGPPGSSKGKVLLASVRVESSDGLPPVSLELECGAKALKLLSDPAAQASSPDGPGDALRSVIQFVADRVVQAMAEQSVIAVAHPPAVKSVTAKHRDELDSLALLFQSTIGHASMVLTLTAETRTS